jgi:hypothetical protein
MSTNLEKNIQKDRVTERQKYKRTERLIDFSISANLEKNIQVERKKERQKDRKTSECLLIWKKLNNKVSAQKDLK